MMRSPRSRRSAAAGEEEEMISPEMAVAAEKVAGYSDLDLRRELNARSFSCGPIVGTTRSVYRKKLVDLILAEVEPPRANLGSNSVQPELQNGDDEEDDDDDDVEETTESQEDVSSQEGETESQTDSAAEGSDDEAIPSVIEPVPETTVRQRLPEHVPIDSKTTTTSVSYVSEDGRTVKRTTTTTRVVKGVDTVDIIAPTRVSGVTKAKEPVKEEKKSSCWSLLLQLLAILVIGILVYVIVSGSSSPLAIDDVKNDGDVENPPVYDTV